MSNLKKTRIKIIGMLSIIIMVPVIIISIITKSQALESITQKAHLVGTTSQMVKSEIIKISEEYFSDTPVSKGSLWTLEMAPEESEILIPEEQVSATVIEDSESLYNEKPYPVSLENKSGIINRVSFSTYNSRQYINLEKAGQVRNCTKISNDVLKKESLLSPDFKIDISSKEPQVLIMHTHTTESYEPYTRDYYDSSFNSRSTDPTKNIVAVGDKITHELELTGIAVIHDKTIHDYPSYNGSYQRSEQTVSNLLKKYPSIKIVLDIHRDAIQKENGTRVAPTCIVNGKQAAQVMIISGCDDGTMDMPNFLQNFRLASKLQQEMESNYPGFTRSVLFDYRKYNQHLTTGSLLIEVGTSANSFEEALYSGELIGKSIGNYILNT